MQSPIRTVWLLVIVVFFSPIALAGEFRPWSEKIFQHVEAEYGPQAVKRLRSFHDLAVKNQDLPVMAKLRLVNDTMNRLPWIADEKHWKQVDYWATPLETIATFGGDCEDIAIAKWVVLTHLGVSSKKLRLAYAKIKRTGENHMVLLYIDNPTLPLKNQNPLILDNYVTDIKRGSERKDVISIYVSDTHGELILFSEDGNKRSIKGVYENRKMKKFEDLRQKIAENRAKYQALNEGHPLLPQ